jgi:carbon-monoxide dehydrogenase small subunit
LGEFSLTSQRREITFILNGTSRTLSVTPGTMVVDLLRERLGLTGTKIGCRRGECGACAVLVDGKIVASCLFPAMRLEGKHVKTVEGLKSDEDLHPIQKAFINGGAVQCGFCIPGMIISSKSLLMENLNPTLEDIKKALSGNLCRCGGYQKIFQSVVRAAEQIRKRKGE